MHHQTRTFFSCIKSRAKVSEVPSQFGAMSSCGDCALSFVNCVGEKIFDVNAAVRKDCLDCFKKCFETPTNWAQCGWSKNTVVNCVKKNRLTLFEYAYEKTQKAAKRRDDYATTYTWGAPWPTAYLIAINAIPHKNEGWYSYIIEAMVSPLNRRMTARRRRALFDRANAVGDFELSKRYQERYPERYRREQDAIAWEEATQEAAQAAQEAAANAPAFNNLQKVLAVIEECDIPEGKYLELCNLLMNEARETNPFL